MELVEKIIIHPTARSRIGEVDFKQLEFGKYVSDHMLTDTYENGHWGIPEIVPFGDITVSPTMLALHYGQSVFEGLKAFTMEDGRVNLFRVEKHYDRLLKSLERMCMPPLPRDIFIDGLRRLIDLDREWVPVAEGAALYIRPVVFASEAKFGVKVSGEYRLLIFTGPVGPAFARPIRVKVETHYVRACRGGTGAAKCAGNYGGAFYPTQKAREAGYDQVLWTDGRENKYIEESGMMNVLFVINEKIVTPALSDSILDGVTRDSLLHVSELLGIPAETRPVSVEELERAFRQNTITEAFGAGTAAVVAPIEMIHINGTDYVLPAYTDDSIQNRLKKKLEAIRSGKEEDPFGWNHIL